MFSGILRGMDSTYYETRTFYTCFQSVIPKLFSASSSERRFFDFPQCSRRSIRTCGCVFICKLISYWSSKETPCHYLNLSFHECFITLTQYIGTAWDFIDPDEERDPPPPATEISFPHHVCSGNQHWNADTPPANLEALFCKVRHPSRASITDLNLSGPTECALEDLVPNRANGTSYASSASPEDAPTLASYADAAKADPIAELKRKDFKDRCDELALDNDTGYRIITKTFKAETKPRRLGGMRKFWESLESMSHYWDSSLDQYYSVERDEEQVQSNKRPRLDQDSTELELGKTDIPEQNQSPLGTPSADTATLSNMPNGNPDPERANNMRYKGRRKYAGSTMPEDLLINTVRGFMEGVVWPFQATVSAPRPLPRVKFGRVNVPVRQTAAVYMVPEERIKARQGWRRGPLMGLLVQARMEPKQIQHSEPTLSSEFLREIGTLLHLAQERQHEGKPRVKQGEGKWWTTKPRWGGGPGGETPDEVDNTDIVQAIEARMGSTEAGSENMLLAGKRPKSRPFLIWKQVKCGANPWDPKTDYEAIGRDRSSPFDEVSASQLINVLVLTCSRPDIPHIRSQPPHLHCQDDRPYRIPRLSRNHAHARNSTGES
jgi:hypothetical protein